MDRIKNYRTLKDENIDRERGFNEIASSPVFKNFVISEDKTTTGIIVNIKSTEANAKQFQSKKELQTYKDKLKEKNHNNILEIRDIIKSFSDIGKIHLGGIPMIADDMMTFIKSDIFTFGIGVFLLLFSLCGTYLESLYGY